MMNTLNLVSFIVAGNVAIIFIGLCVTVLWLVHRSHKRDYRAAQALMECIKQREDAHRDNIAHLLETAYGNDFEQVMAKVEVILNKEHQLYDFFVDIYIKRDTDKLLHIFEKVDDLAEKYYVPNNTAGLNHTQAQPAFLNQENERLTEQLYLTKSALDKVFTHYVHEHSDKEIVPEKMTVQAMMGMFATMNGAAFDLPKEKPHTLDVEQSIPVDDNLTEICSDNDNIALDNNSGEPFEQSDTATELSTDTDLKDETEDKKANANLASSELEALLSEEDFVAEESTFEEIILNEQAMTLQKTDEQVNADEHINVGADFEITVDEAVEKAMQLHHNKNDIICPDNQILEDKAGDALAEELLSALGTDNTGDNTCREA